MKLSTESPPFNPRGMHSRNQSPVPSRSRNSSPFGSRSSSPFPAKVSNSNSNAQMKHEFKDANG